MTSPADTARRLAADCFDDEAFEQLELAGMNLSAKEFTRCTFRNCKLQETRWDGSRLEDCVFEGCDLTNMHPRRLSLRGVQFSSCKLLGVTWTDVASFPMVTFTDCIMRYQSFVSIKLPNSRFVRCAIVESTFVDVDLTRARFSDCDLVKTQFERCELVGTDFSDSRGLHFDTTRNRARGARIPVETAALMATALGLVVAGYGEES